MTNSPDIKTPWGGRFERSPEALAAEFGASLPIDKQMWREDIEGSVAHATMLASVGVITPEDAQAIAAGLAEIAGEIERGTFVWDIADEDVHMAIERVLTERIGPAGARLHTGRSRNDQVVTDLRLHLKRLLLTYMAAVNELRGALVALAQRYPNAVMPGYTHLQRAQPVLVAHHLLAYAQMLSRDFTRARHAYEAADTLVLGSAALAGTTYPLDRDMVARALGFGAVSANSLDAVSDRDFVADALYACALCQVHLSRLSEEIIIWSTGEFGFVTLDDSYSTGSSIMPQKKNPDFAELIRGKTGRVIGDLVGLLATLKGLPLAYNKDMQEDKEGVFDALLTTTTSLRVMSGMVETIRLNEPAMARAAVGGFMAATDLADYLVTKGLPFRDAHEVVGKIVLRCEHEGITLQDLTPGDYAAIDPLFGEDIASYLTPQSAVARRTTSGGTAPARVAEQLEVTAADLGADNAWVGERS